MKNLLNASWRTTVMGIATALVILGNQAIAFLDNNPETNISLDEITAALGVLGIGVLSRDNSVSSEAAGAN